MMELFKDDGRRIKQRKQKPVRLILEELEGRCLLSSAVIPVGGISTSPNGNVWFPQADPRGLFYYGPPIPPQMLNEIAIPPDRIGMLNPTTGVIQDFSVPAMASSPAIVWGPDGNLWFSEDTKIGRLNPATGEINEYALPPDTHTRGQFTLGSDGAIWFLEDNVAENSPLDSYKLARIDPGTGAIQGFNLPSSYNYLSVTIGLFGNNRQEKSVAGSPSYLEITAGSDGSFWISETRIAQATYFIAPPHMGLADFMQVQSYMGVARFNPSTGNFQEFPTASVERGLIWGSDGKLWSVNSDPNPWSLINYGVFDFNTNPFIEPYYGYDFTGQSIVQLDPNTGQSHEFEPPSGSLVLSTLTKGLNGNLWFLLFDTSSLKLEVGDINPGTGTITTFNLSSNDKFIGPWITATPDGRLWFPQAHGIGEFNPSTGTYQEFVVSAQPASGWEVPSGSTVNNGSISATGTAFSTFAGFDLATILAGSEFGIPIATFTPQTPIPSAGAAYQATIDWGDGSSSSLVLTVTENATYDVTAGHTYQTAGTYSIKVTMGNYNPANPLGDNAVTVFSTANVQVFDFNPFG